MRTIYIIILIIAILPETVTLLHKYSENPFSVDKNLVLEANKIRPFLKRGDSILILNLSRNGNELVASYNVPLMSSLLSYPVYFEPEVTDFPGLNAEIDRRGKNVSQVNELISNGCSNYDLVSREVAKKMKETRNNFLLAMKEIPCLEHLTSLKKVNETGVYSFYKLN